jgi:hypothetical protein
MRLLLHNLNSLLERPSVRAFSIDAEAAQPLHRETLETSCHAEHLPGCQKVERQIKSVHRNIQTGSIIVNRVVWRNQNAFAIVDCLSHEVTVGDVNGIQRLILFELTSTVST